MLSEASSDAVAECARVVRAEDPDRFLCLVQAGKADRPGLAALFAFHAEIARTRDVVSEPLLGEIRLQWWRETIEELASGVVREHYVAQALAPCLEAGLSEAELVGLVNAREADLHDEPLEGLAALEDYARGTSGDLQALAAKLLGGAEEAQQAARHVGIAWAYCGLIRALPHHADQGRVLLPRDWMRAEGLVDPARPDKEQTEALGRLLRRLESEARDHLARARALKVHVGARQRPALRLAPLTEGYFGALKKAQYDPGAADYERTALGRQARLWGRILRRSY